MYLLEMSPFLHGHSSAIAFFQLQARREAWPSVSPSLSQTGQSDLLSGEARGPGSIGLGALHPRGSHL